MSSQADLSKAVMTDGNWYLVPKAYVNGWVSKGRESVIVHKCPLYEDTLLSSAGTAYNPLGFWVSVENVNQPCKLCDVRPPEAIASLFLLHNFDTFSQETSFERAIRIQIDRTLRIFEHSFFIHQDPCRCRACNLEYGPRNECS